MHGCGEWDNIILFFLINITPLTPLLYHTMNFFASVSEKKKALFLGFF
jgi:hypothetical protein